MMVLIDTYLRRGRRKLRSLAVDPKARRIAKVAAFFLGGAVLSAASLASSAQSLTLGLILALSGWQGAVAALGGAVGYLLFWGRAGWQGVAWLAAGLPVAAVLNRRKITREVPTLMCAIAGLIVSAVGLGFQLFAGDTTSVGAYLLRIALAAASTRLFVLVAERRDPVADWIAEGVIVLALSQVSLFPGFSLGFVAAGIMGVYSPFPGAALAGMALDLAQVTAVPMTVVLCLSYLVRLLPWERRHFRFWVPGAVYWAVMGLTGSRELVPVLGLVLGGGLAVLLPPAPELRNRRGETGLAQVRLELMAGVMAQSQQLLLEDREAPIDEEAILARAKERACGSCPCRKGCKERTAEMSTEMLHKPLLDQFTIPLTCKKPARMVMELRRSQEQLRALRSGRERRDECRWAVAQQYQFLAEYLRTQADLLSRRGEKVRQRFTPEVAVCSAGRESANGDRVAWFQGTGGKYYVILCDGMGTGLGAAQEGQLALNYLRQMLTAGFPAEHALRSVNSFLVLGGRAGAATMDVAELRLDTGRAVLYKWGAAPSWMVRGGMAEKIGTAGPPPGLSVTDGREMVERLSLCQGESLVLTSDGVDGEDVRGHWSEISQQAPGEMAAKLLELGCRELQDDATVAVIRLDPGALST